MDQSVITLILDNWELITIFILLLDKIVAMTPTPYDDMIVTAIKGAIEKMAGKKLNAKLGGKK